MAWVHATVGAAIGGRAPNRVVAFAAGVVSHLVCDLAPHRDYDLPIEIPLLGIALAAIAHRRGIDSLEMIGALGAISPDIENGLQRIGVVDSTLFPTHTERSWSVGHGRAIKSPLNQILLAAVCVAVMELGESR